MKKQRITFLFYLQNSHQHLAFVKLIRKSSAQAIFPNLGGRLRLTKLGFRFAILRD